MIVKLFPQDPAHRLVRGCQITPTLIFSFLSKTAERFLSFSPCICWLQVFLMCSNRRISLVHFYKCLQKLSPFRDLFPPQILFFRLTEKWAANFPLLWFLKIKNLFLLDEIKRIKIFLPLNRKIYESLMKWTSQLVNSSNNGFLTQFFFLP